MIQACRLRPDQLTLLYRRIHDSISSIPGVSAVALCIYSPLTAAAGGEAFGWTDIRPSGPKDDNYAACDRVTRGILGSYRESRSSEDATYRTGYSNSRVTWPSSTKRLRESFSGTKNLLENTSASDGTASEREYEIVGIAKDSRYLTFNLSQPVGSVLFSTGGAARNGSENGLPVNRSRLAFPT